MGSGAALDGRRTPSSKPGMGRLMDRRTVLRTLASVAIGTSSVLGAPAFLKRRYWLTAQTAGHRSALSVQEYSARAIRLVTESTVADLLCQFRFSDLNAEQLNKAIHRMRTENCTCGCPEDTIDECLVNDPACGVAVTLAEQIQREVKL